eukprot:1160753-Pelagomonas_calceolata.AAC.2
MNGVTRPPTAGQGVAGRYGGPGVSRGGPGRADVQHARPDLAAGSIQQHDLAWAAGQDTG